MALKSELEVSLKLDSTTTGLFRDNTDRKAIILKILSPHLKDLAVDLAKSLPADLVASWKSKVNVSNINALAAVSADAQKIAAMESKKILDAFLAYVPPPELLKKIKIMFLTIDRYAAMNGKDLEQKKTKAAVEDFKIKVLPALLLNGCYSTFGAHLQEKTPQDGPGCVWALFIAAVNQGSTFEEGQVDPLSKTFTSKTPDCPPVIMDMMRIYIPQIHKYLNEFVWKVSKI